MYTLQNFYKSEAWYNLTRVIKMERLDKDGQLICEHCGQPIVREYDAICHHTEYLTEDNVNDSKISLNPEKIQVVHHKCHNRIHEKFGYIKREVYLVYGSPMSGKTTWVKQVMCEGDLIIDIDNIWQFVSGLERYKKPQRLNAVVFGTRDLLIQMVKRRVGKWNNAYIVGGYPLISERERLCKELGAREIYIDSTKEKCYERLYECEDGRDKNQWKTFIDEWWDRYAPGTFGK